MIKTKSMFPLLSRHRYLQANPNHSSWSQLSLASNDSDGGARRLALVFFDILLLDNTSLIDESYATRRATLESVIRTKAGYAMLASRKRISPPRGKKIADIKNEYAASMLRQIMAEHIASYEEGLVLKAEEGKYNDWRMPWVKVCCIGQSIKSTCSFRTCLNS